MPTLAEQGAAIVADLNTLRERDKGFPLPSMLAQWSAELSVKHRCQVVVMLVPVPGKPGEIGLVAYPLLSQSAIESSANRTTVEALWSSEQSGTEEQGR